MAHWIVIAKPGSILLAISQQKVSRQIRGRTAMGTEGVALDVAYPLEMADPFQIGPQVKKIAKSSKTIRVNKRKAKLRAKRRRQRAPAAG